MILDCLFHAQRGTGKDGQCETLAIKVVLNEEVHYMYKMDFQPKRPFFSTVREGFHYCLTALTSKLCATTFLTQF